MHVKNKKRTLIFIFIIAAILLSVFIIKYVSSQYQKDSGTPAYSKDAVDWDGSFGEDAEEGMITIPGYDTVPLKEGSDTAKIELVNPGTNDCLFQYELILEDSDEVLYTSDMLEPGKAIMSQKLSQTLTEGDYPLIIRVNTFSKDGEESYNGSDIETTLHVYKE